MSQSNTEIVRTFYEALRAGNGEKAFARFAEAIDWREADGFPYSDRNPYTTPQAVAEGVLGRISADWKSFTVCPEHLTANGDTVVVLGRYGGVHKRTGKRLDVPVCHVWTVRAGQITAFRQYVDTLIVQRSTAWSMARPWLRLDSLNRRHENAR
jgi:ketosteroid isomerase-like protein